MYRVFFTMLALLSGGTLLGQNFVTRWDTNQPGSPSNEITIPTNPGYTYDYTIEWGDGNVDSNVTGNITHVYTTPGIYSIEISGDFPAIYFNNTGDRQKIIEILQWGAIQWQTMEGAFHGCANLNFDAIDAPDLSQVSSLRNMFRTCSSFNGILNNWDVSTIEDMSGLFAGCGIFNRPLDLWNTISVTTMEETFLSARLFNEPLDNWNTAQVSNMRYMFSSASDFNQNINNWDVSNVTDMGHMFSGASDFNQPLSNWNVSNVTDMSNMFQSTDFNFPIGNWNVSNVTDMSGMFSQSKFNQPIENWNVGNVTNMSRMFQRHRTFNQPLNNWNVSNVTDMSSMFDGWFWDQIFNQPLNNWDVGNVTNMSYMFRDNSGFNQDISLWNVSSVTNMRGMFEEATVFNQDISNWDVGNVTDMSSMFKNALVFNQPLNSWNMGNVSDISSMFEQTRDFDQPLNSWDIGSVSNLQGLFRMARAFNQDISTWNTGAITNMSRVFESATSFDQDLANWNVENVTDMSIMLSNSAISQQNYDNTLIGWASQTVGNDVNLGALNLTYCDGLNARQELIDDHNWNITGDSVNCSFVLCTEITMPAAGDTQVPANSDIRWAPAPNANGYRVTLEIERGGSRNFATIDGNQANNYDVGNVVGLDFTNEFLPGDTIYVTVVPYNDEGPATGCQEINFTVVESWVNSPDAFKLTYDTTIQYSTQTTPVNQLLIETSPGLTYDYSIDWGDGQYDNNVTSDIVHTYLVPGIYTVSIIGTFPAPRHEEFNSDAYKLISIDQWGTQIWETMQGAFAGCNNMVYNATDVPNLSNVTDMSRMFIVCRNFNGNINNWDVSNVTNMLGTFGVASIFNQPLDNWDVSNVENMSLMFFRTDEFDQDISNWNTSNVTRMERMFEDADAFNQPLNNWDVSNVTDMHQMFQRTQAFNQPLDNWNVGNVTDMESMFDGAQAFNQNIDSWDVSSVVGMAEMFREALVFNQPLNSWNVASVAEMQAMFSNAQAFNQPLGNWNVSSVINMNSMFSNASNFNQNIDSWNVTNVTDMSRMFSFAISYDQPLNNWDVNSVVNMSSMFQGAEVFNQALDNWNVSAVANMTSMFEGAIAFNQPINSWDVSSVTLMRSMFEDASSFNQDINSWNVAVVTDFGLMFKNAVAFNRPLNSWNTGEALNMAEMFSGATTFDQPIDNWNVSFVTTMEDMFNNASTFNQTLNAWNVGSVTTMEGMFQNATAFNGTINDWNVRSVSSMQDMFNGATNFNQSVNDWRINGVNTMEAMFQNATAFNQGFDLWLPGTVTMRNMLNGATAFDQYLGDWTVGNVTNMQNMLDNTSLSRENYDNTLIAWSEQTLTAGITLGALGLPYCDALQERQSIIDTYGWSVIGDVLDCPIPECTELVSPLNGATDVPVNTNLVWEHALYSEQYDLTITIMPSNTVIDETVTETSYEFAPGVLNLGDNVSVEIIPSNGTGAASGCPVESFTIASTPPSAPDCTNLINPIAGSVDVAIDTDLEWNPIANADGYRITLGTSSGGNDILDDENVGNVTTYDLPTNLPEDTEIFVTIIPYNEEGDAVGCLEETFTTELIPVPPACTTLSNPLNGANNVPVDTNISWNPVDGATGYIIIVGTSQGGNDVAPSIVVDTGTTFDFTTDLQENRTHYVTIIPFNDIGDALACTEESFRTGISTLNDPPACTTLSNPLGGATDVPTDLAQISWNAVGNADGYRITINGSSSDLNDVTDLTITGTSHAFTNEFENGETVNVTIVPFNLNGDATTCVSESFTIIPPAPTPPTCTTLSNPLNGTSDVAVDLAEISWNIVDNADGYRITIDGSTSDLNDVTDLNVTETSHPFTNEFENGETVTMTIVPFNSDGDAMGCTTESFTIIAATPNPPNCTTLSNPLNGANNIPVDLAEISWNAVGNANGYRITVNGSSGDLNDVNDLNVTETSHPFTNEFENGETVTVTIVPFNSDGDAMGCTTESFTIVSEVPMLPECTNLLYPLNFDVDVPLNSNLTWNASMGADGYRLTVGTESGLGDLFNGDIGNVTSFDLPNNLPENTEIFVFIQPYNTAGDAEFCEEESFITTMQTVDLPLCTTLSNIENGSINIAVNTDINWRAVGDIDGYILNLGTSTGANDILSEDVGLTTSYQLIENLPFGEEIFVTIIPYNESAQAEACESQSFTTVEEETEEVESQFGFSPDGDGNNDFWTINGIEEYPNNIVMIYNRWGDLVFKIAGYDNISNVFRGEANQLTGMGAGQLPEGTYFFHINISTEHNLKTTQGYLVLKR